MTKKKISMPKKVKQEIDKYPMVSVEWYDIVSDSSWSSFNDVMKSKLATCITKGHLLSQAKGVTRIFGDYSYNDNKTEIEKKLEELSNKIDGYNAKTIEVKSEDVAEIEQS